MIYHVERDSQAAPHLIGTMTLSAADRSTQNTIVVACVVVALLALPFMGALHCQVAHDDHGQASTPLTEACCVFLCFTALVGMIIISAKWPTLAHAALNLKPVRLTNRLTRWVPPPRSIGFLT